MAIDVDGTLLDSAGVLRLGDGRRRRARAAEAGIRPVLCTGRDAIGGGLLADRRGRLGIDAPVVCNSGALVKRPSDGRTLLRADLGDPLVGDVLTLFDRLGEPPLRFVDAEGEGPDFLVPGDPTGRPHFDEFIELNRPFGRVFDEWDPPYPDFHICAVGTREGMLAFEEEAARALGPRIRTFVQKSPRYSGTMCEILHVEASKWSAVRHLARLWGIEPSEICAVGDDMNDLPMIVGAGLGVAMGQAPAFVRESADLVTADHESDGLARLIDDVLLS